MEMPVANAHIFVGLPGVTSTHVHTRDVVGIPSAHEDDYSATLELPGHGMESSILRDESASGLDSQKQMRHRQDLNHLLELVAQRK